MVNKSPQKDKDQVLVKMDRSTAQVFQAIGNEMHFSVNEVARFLAWIGRKSMGRKVIIQNGNEEERIEMSLEEYRKLAKNDLT